MRRTWWVVVGGKLFCRSAATGSTVATRRELAPSRSRCRADQGCRCNGPRLHAADRSADAVDGCCCGVGHDALRAAKNAAAGVSPLLRHASPLPPSCLTCPPPPATTADLQQDAECLRAAGHPCRARWVGQTEAWSPDLRQRPGQQLWAPGRADAARRAAQTTSCKKTNNQMGVCTD